MSRHLAFHLSVLNGPRKKGLMFAINSLHFGGDIAVVGGATSTATFTIKQPAQNVSSSACSAIVRQ